jgi:hypothetical protein
MRAPCHGSGVSACFGSGGYEPIRLFYMVYGCPAPPRIPLGRRTDETTRKDRSGDGRARGIGLAIAKVFAAEGATWLQTRASTSGSVALTCQATRYGSCSDRQTHYRLCLAKLMQQSPRRALWPAVMSTAPTGRTHGRTDQPCRNDQQNPCQRGAVHTWHAPVVCLVAA